jgi:hypothetical protein
VTELVQAEGFRAAPEAALGAGRRDPFALLTVWCARKSFFPVLWIGLAVAQLRDPLADVSFDLKTTSPDPRSPLSVVWLALVIRLGSAAVGYVLAYPIARRQQASYAYRTGIFRYVDLATDRWQLTRSLSSFRSTYPVRAAAIARLGRLGRRFATAAIVINVLNNVFFVLLVVVVYRTTS